MRSWYTQARVLKMPEILDLWVNVGSVKFSFLRRNWSTMLKYCVWLLQSMLEA
jgi:hypothetical protein